MNCEFIGKSGIYEGGYSTARDFSFYDTLTYFPAYDWPIDPLEQGCLTSLTLSILLQTGGYNPSADNADAVVAELHIVTAAHGTEAFSLSSADPAKYVFSTRQGPDYLLEPGDNIEFWVKNPGTYHYIELAYQMLRWLHP